jgi:hypothetical protein
MKFPDLIILDEVPNENKIGDFKTLLLCKLDWTSLDNHKIKRSKEWISQFLLENRNKDEDRILKLILDEYNWQEELYPNQFNNILSFLDSFEIPKSYYEEIKHFENLALNEWNRRRPFDTAVRDECLSIAIESVYLYFYMIKDALMIYNRRVDNSEILHIIESVLLFRFWKGQIGSGLVIQRALKNISKFKHLKEQNDLYNHLETAFNYCLELSVVPTRDETKFREMIKTRIRDEKIIDILE